jgi:GT2 family glycosyltransferase
VSEAPARRVTAIVVTYRSAAELPACLSSLAAQEGVALEVVVVDNASDDGSADLARRLLPSATVIANEANVGYGRANNQVMLTREADFFAIVNPDTILPPGAIATAVAALEADETAGVAGLCHVGADGRPQPTAFAFLDLTSLLGEMFALDRVFPRVAAFSTRRIRTLDGAGPVRVEWLQGSFLVVRSEAVRRAGGFDPEIFMYGEDMEWGWRLRNAGFHALWLPGPVVRHIGGASGRGRVPELYVEDLKSRIRFFARHRGMAAAFLARAIVGAAVTARWVAAEIHAGLAAPFARGSREGTVFVRRAIFRAATRWAWTGARL